jgi:N-acetylglucosaminyldiphosphoundecaprenol N-acetyl-beta-D-mannosaminyltransferase
MGSVLTERGGIGSATSRSCRQTVFILGVRADNIRGETALDLIQGFARDKERRASSKVIFTNVHTIHSARRDPELLSCINNADLVLPDGAGLKIAGRLLGSPILENLNGTDFIPRVLFRAVSERWTVYLLGAQQEVVDACRHWLLEQYPGLQVVGFHDGHFSHEEEERIVEDINIKCPHILLVSMGTPVQEKWIARNATRLNAGVCLAVGGLFDFLSGAKARAPIWMRRFGIEWLFRFVLDPKSKWQRVFVEIPAFLSLILIEWLLRRRVRTPVLWKGSA